MDFDGSDKSPEFLVRKDTTRISKNSNIGRRIVDLVTAGVGIKNTITRRISVSVAALCLEAK